MNDSPKKFSKFIKHQIDHKHQIKMHDKIFPKKSLDLKNIIIPNNRNQVNHLGYIHFQTQNFNKVSLAPSYYTIDSYYSSYNNFNRIRPLSKEPIITETKRKYLSYSQDKNYFDLKNANTKSFMYIPKALFCKSDICNNEYNYDNYNNYFKYNDYIYYNNYNIMENMENGNLVNCSINMDRISNLRINNFDNINSTTSFNTINNDKMKSNYNNYIINTNISYNYINNSINFNSINDSCYNRYNTNLNSYVVPSYNKLKIHINEDPYVFYSNTDFYDNFDEEYYKKFQYYSQKNIKDNNNDYYSKQSNEFKNKSKQNNLKENISSNQPILNKYYKYTKTKKKNNSFNKLSIEKIELLNKTKEMSSNKIINKITQTRERKHKIKIESKNQNKNNNIKTLFSSKSRTNNNSKDFSYKKSNNFHVIKNTKKNNIALIKKENSNMINNYIINNIDSFSRNNHKKKEIFHFKKGNVKTSLLPLNKKNSQTMINSTGIKILAEKQKNRITNKKEEENPDIKDKYKKLKTNKIITKNSIKIKTNLNNYYCMENNKISKVINKNQLNKKMLTSRKHKKIFLSNLIKKECQICHKEIDSHLFKIHFNSHPTQILDWLFLGTFSNACDIEELRRNKINYILNCATECNNNKLPIDIEELHLDTKDAENFNIIEYFDEANDFINRCRFVGGKILVHCKFGISRSPTFIIAYLSRYNKQTVDEALNFVRQKRSQIKPNKGFLNQLYLYEDFFWKR